MMNKGSEEVSSCVSHNIGKDLDEFIEHTEVQDRALKRKTQLVKIRDPCNGNVLATLRDPKAKIDPYRNKHAIINIQEHIDKRELPKFYKGEPSIAFNQRKGISWKTLHDIIKAEERQQVFWDLIKDVKKLRISYNKILLSKFKTTKKKPLYAKNIRIHTLFNEYALEVTKDEQGGPKNS